MEAVCLILPSQVLYIVKGEQQGIETPFPQHGFRGKDKAKATILLLTVREPGKLCKPLMLKRSTSATILQKTCNLPQA